MKQYIKNKKGISLIEAVLTVFVLAIGFMSSMQAIQEIVSNTKFSGKEIVATQLAQEKLENIMADRQAFGFGYIIGSNYPNEVLTGAYAGFERRTFIMDVNAADLNTPAGAGQLFKNVRVDVKYGSTGAIEKVSMVTLVGDY